jgi:hypothetical protein
MGKQDERRVVDAAQRNKLQELVASYTGPVKKIPMGKRTTRGSKYKHIGKMQNIGRNRWVAIPEQSQRWGEDGTDINENLLWGR